MRSVSVHELKRDLSRLLRDVEAGARILVTRHGRPVAALDPAPEPGLHVGRSSPAGNLHAAIEVDEERQAKVLGLLLADRSSEDTDR